MEPWLLVWEIDSLIFYRGKATGIFSVEPREDRNKEEGRQSFSVIGSEYWRFEKQMHAVGEIWPCEARAAIP